MYFWNIQALKEDIKNDSLAQRDVYNYIMYSIIFTIVGIESVQLFPAESINELDYVNSFLVLFLTILGVSWAYRSNDGDAGKDFAQRYFSISWVVLIRYSVFFFPLLFVGYFLQEFVYQFQLELSGEAEQIEEPVTVVTTWMEVVVLNLWTLLLYRSIAKHIKEVAEEVK